MEGVEELVKVFESESDSMNIIETKERYVSNIDRRKIVDKILNNINDYKFLELFITNIYNNTMNKKGLSRTIYERLLEKQFYSCIYKFQNTTLDIDNFVFDDFIVLCYFYMKLEKYENLYWLIKTRYYRHLYLDEIGSNLSFIQCELYLIYKLIDEKKQVNIQYRNVRSQQVNDQGPNIEICERTFNMNMVLFLMYNKYLSLSKYVLFEQMTYSQEFLLQVECDYELEEINDINNITSNVDIYIDLQIPDFVDQIFVLLEKETIEHLQEEVINPNKYLDYTEHIFKKNRKDYVYFYRALQEENIDLEMDNREFIYTRNNVEYICFIMSNEDVEEFDEKYDNIDHYSNQIKQVPMSDDEKRKLIFFNCMFNIIHVSEKIELKIRHEFQANNQELQNEQQNEQIQFETTNIVDIVLSRDENYNLVMYYRNSHDELFDEEFFNQFQVFYLVRLSLFCNLENSFQIKYNYFPNRQILNMIDIINTLEENNVIIENTMDEKTPLLMTIEHIIRKYINTIELIKKESLNNYK